MNMKIDDDSYDFGFSEIQTTEEPKDNRDLLRSLDKKITLLLKNLSSGDGDMIKWPDRKAKIAQFEKYYREVMDQVLK